MGEKISLLVKKLGVLRIFMILLAGILLMLSYKSDNIRENDNNFQRNIKNYQYVKSDENIEFERLFKNLYGEDTVEIYMTYDILEHEKVYGVVAVIDSRLGANAALSITQSANILFGVQANKVKILYK